MDRFSNLVNSPIKSPAHILEMNADNQTTEILLFLLET